MVIAFDLDGTLCSVTEDYENAVPIIDMVKLVNKRYDNGDTIYIYTGRHMINEGITRRWLDSHGVKRHSVFYGKPVADYYVDDKAIRYSGNHKLIESKLT